jgi:hypothetical protein
MANDPFKEDSYELGCDDHHSIPWGGHHRRSLFRQAERSTQKKSPPVVEIAALCR